MKNTSTQVMFRVQTRNRTSELGRYQEAELKENNAVIFEKFTKINMLLTLDFWMAPMSNLVI